MQTHILIIDDEAELLEVLSALFCLKKWKVECSTSAEQGWKLLSEQEFDLVLCDLAMPGMSGLDLLKRLRAENNPVPFIIMTGVGTIQSAVEAVQCGAYNYITKPFITDELEIFAQRAIDYGRLHRELARPEQEKSRLTVPMLPGGTKVMQELCETVYKIAPSPAAVLIQGETGTGKSLLASAIHQLSDRSDQPFLTIDCGAMAENLLESELFGHVKGAFTGAVQARRGLLQDAEGGTVFLDEIGELSANMQVKILRTVQEHEVRPLGSNKVIPIDVRFITATNRHLMQEVEAGRFREDLYYRLAVILLNLPPLRERRDDLVLFASHFVHKYALRYNKNITGISPAALHILSEQSWKGNIRELENVLERAVLLTDSAVISPGALGIQSLAPLNQPPEEGVISLQQALQDTEKKAIRHTLSMTQGNRTKAAALLGISRQTLYDKLSEYKL